MRLAPVSDMPLGAAAMNDTLMRYDWAFFICLAVAAVGFLWVRERWFVRPNSSGTRMANGRALAFLFWLTLPWVVIGIGVIAGFITGTEDAFNLKAGVYPYICVASIIAVWCALLVWIFARGGAEELARSGQLTFAFLRVRDPESVKFLFALMVGGGILGLIGFIITQTT